MDEAGNIPHKWDVSYSGFLEKKSPIVGMWQLRWAVIDNGRLLIYGDETESVLKEKFIITPSSVVESQEPESKRQFVFTLRDPSGSDKDFVMSAFDMPSLEAWMIALIQSINGSYRPSENFCSGYSVDRASSLIVPSVGGMNTIFASSFDVECDLELEAKHSGFLIKQGSRVKSWKRRWFELTENRLRYYESEGGVMKGEKRIDDETRVVMLPPGYDGQQCGFSLLTIEPETGIVLALRLSPENEDDLYRWIAAIHFMIKCCKEDVRYVFNCLSPTGNILDSSPESGETLKSAVVEHQSSPTYARAQRRQSPAFYINDNTIWARIRRTLSPGEHTVSNNHLQALYVLHFCHPISSPDSSIPNMMLVEVFEHQRYIPLKGWSCLNLLPNDCAKLANAEGIKYPDRYLRRADPPEGYHWCEESEAVGVNTDSIGTHSPWKWTLCKSYTSVGDKSWAYGRSFADLRVRCRENRSHPAPQTTDVVRRRRWLRVAVPNNISVNDSLPFERLCLAEQYSQSKELVCGDNT
mmetsp:Transcript_844/g.1418  ORF Transcript_844/g.1418 Transcript_844/m.1418 type:complete len:524 (+) Transcript_844:64-1635(+)